MRPICRGNIPAGLSINKYEAAKADLVSRLGRYCSYCEREIATVLAVEHIQPKGLPAYQHLENEWTNFLLACVNCNSTKKDKDVVLSEVLLPDRDNTSHAFNYLDDGSIAINATLVGTPIEAKARSILNLTGLDKSYSKTFDANGNAVALDRKAQRIEAFGEARVALNLYLTNQTDEMITAVVMMAKARGYFSIWYQVFDAFPAVLIRLIQAFPGTSGSGCFSAHDGTRISPAPNPDGLPNGARI